MSIRDEYMQSCGMELVSDMSARSSKPAKVEPKKVPFEEVCADLEKYLPTFKPNDYLHYFQRASLNAGYRYVVTNRARDCAVFKRLSDSYTPKQIITLIDFLFSDKQDYLDKSTLKATVLISGWQSRLFRDSSGGTPTNKRKLKANREWKKDGPDGSVVGEWK